jgi:hypothetical protein
MGNKTGAYKMWRGDLKGRDPFGRRKRRWEDNTKKASSRSGMGRHRLD